MTPAYRALIAAKTLLADDERKQFGPLCRENERAYIVRYTLSEHELRAIYSYRFGSDLNESDAKEHKATSEGTQRRGIRSGPEAEELITISDEEKSRAGGHTVKNGIASTDCFSLDDLFDDPPGGTTIDGVSLFSLSFLFSARTPMPRVCVQLLFSMYRAN